MKRSEVVSKLAGLASNVKIDVTPANVGNLARQFNELFAEAAALINELEAQEAEEAKEDTDGDR